MLAKDARILGEVLGDHRSVAALRDMAETFLELVDVEPR